MNDFTTLLKTGHIAAAALVFGLASAGAQASHSVDHSQGYKVMSMKDDLAHRSPDIHWPIGARFRVGILALAGSPRR